MDESFELIDKDLQLYCENHTTEQDPVLYQLYRETNLKYLRPRMLSCNGQGTFLTMISKMVQPKYILELGTYTAYSTICLSKGLQDGGKIFTIEKDPQLEDIIRKYIVLANIEDKTELRIGRALDIVPTLDYIWDLIFIDADKVNNLSYYNLLIERLNKKGVLLVDNVLWSGKVIEPIKDNDKETKAIVDFNRFVQEDSRVNNMILPFRDGIMMVQKK